MAVGDSEVVPFVALLTDDGDALDLDVLAQTVVDAIVDAGVTTDEELHWMAGGLGRLPLGFIDAPRLSAMRPADRDIALETAMWMLRSAGALRWDERRGAFEAHGPRSVLGAVRASSPCIVTARFGHGAPTDQAEPSRAALFAVQPNVVLTELILPDGLHQLEFRNDRAAGWWLAGIVDARRRAMRTTQAMHGVSPTGLAAAAEQETRLVSHHAADPVTVHFYSGPDGVHMVRLLGEGADPPAVGQQLSAGDLASVLGSIIAEGISE